MLTLLLILNNCTILPISIKDTTRWLSKYHWTVRTTTECWSNKCNLVIVKTEICCCLKVNVLTSTANIDIVPRLPDDTRTLWASLIFRLCRGTSLLIPIVPTSPHADVLTINYVAGARFTSMSCIIVIESVNIKISVEPSFVSKPKTILPDLETEPRTDAHRHL